MTAVSVGESWYKFDGKTYQLARTLRQPIGAEVPKDLSGFEARISLVQRPEQDPESILAQARGWLWQQWWLEKPSYLKVKLHSKEGDETVTTYYIEKGSGQQMLVTIQIHSVLTDRGRTKELATRSQETRSSSPTMSRDDGQSLGIRTEHSRSLKTTKWRQTRTNSSSIIRTDSNRTFYSPA